MAEGHLEVGMSCVETTTEARATVWAMSTTEVPHWLTEWMPAIGMDDATAVMKVSNVAGGVALRPVVQVAEVRPDKPSAAAAIGTSKTTNDDFFFSASDFSLAAKTAGNTYVRFGVMVKISSAPGMGQADVCLQLALRQCGALLAPATAHLVATSATKQYLPITGFLPVLGVSKVELTAIVSSLLGGLEGMLTFRLASTSPEDPEAWDDTGIGSVFDADGESNDGEQTYTATGAMWVQFGFMYYTAGGVGQADVTLLIGVRSG